MLFQLPSFLLFFVVFVGGLSLCPARLRQAYVIAASLFFYAWWYPPFLLVLVGLVFLAWAGARIVERDRGWLPLAVVLALLPLVLFKYADFLLATLEDLTGVRLGHLGWPLPLGISFVTFTVISLIVDITRRRDQPAPTFGETALYITFFPHLIAGPILRPHQMIPQLPQLRFDWSAFAPNLALFAVGMAKKVLVADPIARHVDTSYANASSVGGWEALLAMFGFAIQIYCDFSAYSDMAIALAGMLGIAFPENFRSPYMATSMTELWQRWHMTLSFWLRDYVFRPLHARLHHYSRYAAVVLTMTISGLWHGAAWTFVVWGLALGCIMVAEVASGYSKHARGASGAARWACICVTFLCWAVTASTFRAPDFASAVDIYMGALGARGWGEWPGGTATILSLAAVVLALHPFDQVPRIRAAAACVPAALSVPILLMVIATCAVIAAGRPESFYYFDF